MSKPRPHKRQHPQDTSLVANDTSPPQSKRQKLSSSRPPSTFWNNLSKIWLTKGALRELDRRQHQSASTTTRPDYRQALRPVTRSFLAELRRNRPAPECAGEFLRGCDANTFKGIQAFARRGGPDLWDLRDYPEPVARLELEMSLSQSSSRGQKRGSASTQSTRPTAATATDTTPTESSGVYHRNFQQNLIDGGVYPHAYEYPDGRVPAKPNNWQDINQIMAVPRPSLSPSKFSDGAYEGFVRADAHAAKEKQVSENVIPFITGKVRDAKCVAGGIPFGNLDPLTDGSLKPSNPDLYYGARPEQLNREVRTKLSGSIEPSTQDDLPITPNFFLAAKGPDGSAAVAKRQACYDGALGARGIHSLQTYGQSVSAYDKKAYTVTSIYHNGQLQMYTSHPAQPGGPGTRPEYFMHQIKGYAMTSDPDTFRRGATAFRNLGEWTEKQRSAAIDRANETAADAHRAQSAAPASSSFTTEVSSLVTTTSFGVDSESQSQASVTTLDEVIYSGENARQGQETPSDELSRNATLPAKHASKSQQSGRRKRKASKTGIQPGTTDDAQQ